MLLVQTKLFLSSLNTANRETLENSFKQEFEQESEQESEQDLNQKYTSDIGSQKKFKI